MIRVLLGFALPVLGLGVAAAFVAPSALAPLSGEPIMVASASTASAVQPAGFDSPVCASKLLFAETAGPPDAALARSGLRIMALQPRPGPDGMAFEFREMPAGGTADDAALLLLIDAAGHVIAARDPADLMAEVLDQMRVDGCGTGFPPRESAGAI